MNIKELLDEDISSEMTKLRTTPYDDKNYEAISDTAVKLIDRKIEIEKFESEQRLKEQQLADEKKDRVVKNVIGAAGVVLPLLVTIWGTKVSLEFEKEGTVTTMIGRLFINKLGPKK